VSHTAYSFNFGENNKVLGLDRPTILIKISQQRIGTAEQDPDLYFADLVKVVHEWMHTVESRRFSQGRLVPWTESAQLKQEAATHTAQYWFEAQHGDADTVRNFTAEGLGGYMMRFLDYYEATYKKYWRD
jgi:hypothetical protein